MKRTLCRVPAAGQNSRFRRPVRDTRRTALSRVAITVGAVIILAGCGSCRWNLGVIDYTPVPGRAWRVSTPAAQGMDSTLLDRLYFNAAKVKTLQAVLVVRNGYLIAEHYFNGGGIDNASRLQSATKSVTSALTGIAFEQGYLTSVEQKMVDFFPELAGQVTDSRKYEITIRHMLQMRAGYPWEESTPELFEMLYAGFRPSLLQKVPLATYPDTRFEYSNLTSHLLGVIVARATGTDLRSYARQQLFDPIGVRIVDWTADWEGNYNGHADLYLTARDMARFGLLYLNDGVHDGQQIVPAQWVKDSLATYSEDAWKHRIGRNYRDIGYGYQWWSARAGAHRFNFAWGHGGQQIALVKEHDMVIVVKGGSPVGSTRRRPLEAREGKPQPRRQLHCNAARRPLRGCAMTHRGALVCLLSPRRRNCARPESAATAPRFDTFCV